MILVVESGATKSHWVAADGEGRVAASCTTSGMNISTFAVNDVLDVIAQGAASLPATQIRELYFYVAGVLDADIRKKLESAFRTRFPFLRTIEMESDLLGAARAVCGHSEGIAAIMGTGSNSCLFDGKDIVGRIGSGGYILGDEGSAASLGLSFLKDHIKGLLPKEIEDELKAVADVSYATVVANVYGRKSISPSAYLGSFAPFVIEHYDHPYIKAITDANFRAFFVRCISRYPALPVGIAGGFAYACRDIIRTVAAEQGIEISRFVKSPVTSLVSYHTEKRQN